LPARSDRLSSYPQQFSLKSAGPQPNSRLTLFPAKIGNRVNLQEKSQGWSADRCLNQASQNIHIVSEYSRKSRGVLNQQIALFHVFENSF
jgi:hypothetical protein